MKVIQIGNFRPPHSTENHLREALQRSGHEVIALQENTRTTWDHLIRGDIECDFIVWTRTGWDWEALLGWSQERAHQKQRTFLHRAKTYGIPTVAFHLDRWWGLDREHQLTEPFFQCEYVFTVEGDPRNDWAKYGINHRWMPPGVLLSECEREPEAPFIEAPEIIWVGSWREYHHEWVDYRRELVTGLQRKYGDRFLALPRPGESIRGADLTNLYNTAKVVVGDSCLAGGVTHYWSDRVPETIGRGGILVHPYVEGLEERHPSAMSYELGNFDQLHILVDALLAEDSSRELLRKQGRAHVMQHHTYERRVEQIIGEIGL